MMLLARGQPVARAAAYARRPKTAARMVRVIIYKISQRTGDENLSRRSIRETVKSWRIIDGDGREIMFWRRQSSANAER